MTAELHNSKFNDYDEIEVDFIDTRYDAEGVFVVEDEPDESGRYKLHVILHSPLIDRTCIVSESQQRHIAGLGDRQQVADWIALAVGEAYRKQNIATPKN
jgi:hypothetical protein